uniref:Uncharacterized protein n=1 Tax=Panagrolaimus sp. JU765 TaxID=591449 RepID=A0AC34R1A9_9BILA
MGTWQLYNTLYLNKYEDLCSTVNKAVRNVKYFGHRSSQLNEVFTTYLTLNKPFFNRPTVKNVLVILTAI